MAFAFRFILHAKYARGLAYRSRIMPIGRVRFLASVNYSHQWTPRQARTASMLQRVLGNIEGLGLAHVMSYHETTCIVGDLSLCHNRDGDDRRGAQVL
jgi:hypothetical protein